MDFGLGEFNIAASASYRGTDSHGLPDSAPAGKRYGHFSIEPLTVFSLNSTHWTGSKNYENCSDGRELYRLLSRDDEAFPARESCLKDDYRQALENARNGNAKTKDGIDVKELLPCPECMPEIRKAYDGGEFVSDRVSFEIKGHEGDLDILA